MDQPIASFVGSCSRTEFHTAITSIEALLHAENWNLTTFSQLRDISIETQLIVLAQSYHGEFSQRDLPHMKLIAPLAPIILIAGAYAGGELRTGRPLPGCFRLYACQWDDFYARELARLLQGSRSLFGLPSTCENEEIILEENRTNTDNRKFWKNSGHSLCEFCHIVSHRGPLGNDSAMNRLLAERSRKNNQTVILDQKKVNNSFCGKILADIDDSPPSEILKAVQSLRADFADAEITLYINSPRINEKNALQKAGADVILAKPVCW